MRIALDATYRVDRQPSGIAVYSEQISDGLAAAHPECEYFHYYRPKQFRHAARVLLPNVHRRMLLPFGGSSGTKVFHALNQRVDRRLAPRVVSTFHDLFVMTAEYSTPDFRARFTEQARGAAERSDLIIAISEFTAGQVHELLKVERQRIRVIPHGVRHPAVLPPDGTREPMVLFTGALQARKNLVRLVEAFETLPSEWTLVLAGAPNGYRAEEVLARVRSSRSTERIVVTGYLQREKLDELFARASIFAFPSLAEGFGIPILEAMAWGVPVVTSNSSALAELGGGAAQLIDPESSDSIAEGLTKLAADSGLRQELARAGRNKAATYSWSRSVEETFAVYREL